MSAAPQLTARPSVWVDSTGLRPASLLGQELSDFTRARYDAGQVQLTLQDGDELQLLYGSADVVRVVADVAPGAQVRLYEVLLGQPGKAHMIELTLNLAPQAKVTLCSFFTPPSRKDGKPTLVIRRTAHLLQDAQLDVYSGYLGGCAQSTIEVEHTGDGAQSRLRQMSLTLGEDAQHHAITTRHSGRGTQCEAINHGAALDESQCDFTTLGTIRKGSAGTNLQHRSRVMTLSSKAKANVDPVLIIDEYDVKAAHAGSVGQVDAQTLYYLRSRGLTLSDAYRLVTTGFLLPVVEGFGDQQEQQRIREAIEGKVNAHVG